MESKLRFRLNLGATVPYIAGTVTNFIREEGPAVEDSSDILIKVIVILISASGAMPFFHPMEPDRQQRRENDGK